MSIEEDLKDKSLWADGFQTKSGLPVRILCVYRADPTIPVIALYRVDNEDGEAEEGVNHYASDGTCGNPKFDLIRRSAKRKGWVGIAKNDEDGYCANFLCTDIYDSKDLLLRQIAAIRWEAVACIEIEFTEGEGLP